MTPPPPLPRGPGGGEKAGEGQRGASPAGALSRPQRPQPDARSLTGFGPALDTDEKKA